MIMEQKGNLYELMDIAISSGLDTDVDTYNDIINNKCTYWEARYIISVFINYREDKFQKARDIFNSYLKNNT